MNITSLCISMLTVVFPKFSEFASVNEPNILLITRIIRRSLKTKTKNYNFVSIVYCIVLYIIYIYYFMYEKPLW